MKEVKKCSNKFKVSTNSSDDLIFLSKKVSAYNDDRNKKNIFNEILKQTLTRSVSPSSFNKLFYEALFSCFDSPDIELLLSVSSFMIKLMHHNEEFARVFKKDPMPLKIMEMIKERKNNVVHCSSAKELDFLLSLIEILSLICSKNENVSSFYSYDLCILIIDVYKELFSDETFKEQQHNIGALLRSLSILIGKRNTNIGRILICDDELVASLFQICMDRIYQRTDVVNTECMSCSLSILSSIIQHNPLTNIIESIEELEQLFVVIEVINESEDLGKAFLSFITTLASSSEKIVTRLLEDNIFSAIIPIIHERVVDEETHWNMNVFIELICNLIINVSANEEIFADFAKQLISCESFSAMLVLPSERPIFIVSILDLITKALDFNESIEFLERINYVGILEEITSIIDEESFCVFVSSLISLYQKGSLLFDQDEERLETLRKAITEDDAVEIADSLDDQRSDFLGMFHAFLEENRDV